MGPVSHDFPPLVRGDSETLTVFLAVQDTVTGEISLAPLTGATVEWRILRPGLPDYLRSTATDGGLVLTAADARVDWAITSADWTALPGGTYQYRVRVTYAAGGPKTYLIGTLTILS